MPFLDEEGLRYYNEKITSQISSKQDMNFLDGAPSIRTKQVTAAEYSSLSEEEKMLPIVYLVKGSSNIAYRPNVTVPSTNFSSQSSFDISYDPINDEGIMTLEDIPDVIYPSYSSSSSFSVSYSR